MAANVFPLPKPLTPHAAGLIIALAVQYLLGMTTNLFVQFPEGQRGGKLWVFSWTQLPLILHIILGLLLLFGSSALLARSIRQKEQEWLLPSIIGFAAILIAVITGALFIPSQTDGYSFLMSLAFIIALLSYVWGLYRGEHTSLFKKALMR